MQITSTHRRLAFAAVALLTMFGLGGALGHRTRQPEVITVTVSEEVPTACTDAIDAGFDGLAADRRANQYRDKAAELAADLTFSTLAVDASGIEEALAPMEEQNQRENEWRVTQDEARQAFITAANQCIALATAAEAVNDR